MENIGKLPIAFRKLKQWLRLRNYTEIQVIVDDFDGVYTVLAVEPLAHTCVETSLTEAGALELLEKRAGR